MIDAEGPSPDPKAPEVTAPESGTARTDDAGGSDVAFEREESKRPSQADQVVRLVDEAKVEFWHTPAGDCYATVREKVRIENWPVSSRSFRCWISRRFFDLYEKAPRREALLEAFSVLEGRALGGSEHEIHVRTAGHDGRIYIDLADPERHAVEISADGWRIVQECPVRFRRPGGMLPLPVPVEGGSIDELRPLLNVPSEDAWILIVGFLLAALHPHGPYLILVLLGEQGTGKSTAARMLVMLLDPKDVPLRRPPRDERDLAIAARHGRVLAFNNLSHLSDFLSDGISALATEGGFVTRSLYTDDDEARFKERRPIVLNGIPDFVTRGDLVDRSVKVVHQRIEDGKRRSEVEVLAEFERIRPRLLGALCSAVAVALRNLASVVLPALPRMADATKWITAAEVALGWEPGTFFDAYRRATGEAIASVVESDSVAVAVLAFATTAIWRGTAGDLLKELTARNSEAAKRKDWPGSPQAMGSSLRRIAPALRQMGLIIEEDTRKDSVRRLRLWTVSRRAEDGDRTEPGSDVSGVTEVSEAAQHSPASPSTAETSPETSAPLAADLSRPEPLPETSGVDSETSPCGDEAEVTNVIPCDDGTPKLPRHPKLQERVSSGHRCPHCGNPSVHEGCHAELCPVCARFCTCAVCRGKDGLFHV